MSFPSVSILGVPITSISNEQLLNAFSQDIESRNKGKQVCITAVNAILSAVDDAEVMTIYQKADYVLCDGVPVKWASSWLGKPVPERITGLDLLPDLLELSQQKQYRLFFLGASPGVADTLASLASRKYPGLIVAGVYCPPFRKKFSVEENQEMQAMINAAKPDVLLVSLTAPKQDIWIAENLPFLSVPLAIGFGGAFEVTAGIFPRAPKWMQKNGLEWLFRLFKEPKRMWHRYLIEAPRFIPLVFIQLCKQTYLKYIR